MECTICYKEMDNKNAIELDCNHVFHEVCLDRWRDMCRRRAQQPVCPVCRSTTLRQVIHIDTLPRLPIVISSSSDEE